MLNKYEQYSPLLLIIIIFIFYTLFSGSIPPFWEDHSFQQRFIQTSTIESLNETFKIGNDNLFYLGRPFFALYFKLNFFFFKYNFFLHKFIKIIVLCLFAYILFLFLKKQTNCTNLALNITLVTFLSYPFYSNTLQFDNPFFLSEFFKVLAIIFLVIDIQQKTTSLLNQFFIILFSILAFRTYNQAWSVVGIIILFVLLYQWQLLKRYSVIFIILISYNFPVQILHGLSTVGSYAGGVKVEGVLRRFFITNTSVFYNPLNSPQSLYYMSFLDVLTFFGIWLCIIYVIVKIIKKIYPSLVIFSAEKIKKRKLLTRLCLAWIICEIPLFFIAPDPTVRYLSGIMIPFFILFFIAIKDLFCFWRKNLQKYVKIFIVIMIICMLCINVGYAYLFRITWGSAFIAVEKTNDYIEKTRESNTYVLYYAGTAAREYFPLDKTSENYVFKDDVIYSKSGTAEFSEENLLGLKHNYTEVYVLQRVSAFGNSQYPYVDFSNYTNLELVKIIDGNGADIIDLITGFLANIIGKEYTYNEIYVYKVINRNRETDN